MTVHDPFIGPPPRTAVPLRRPVQGRLVAGVAAGLADHLGIDVTYVRLGMVALTLLGPGALLYAAAWLLVPEEGADHTVADELLQGHFGARP